MRTFGLWILILGLTFCCYNQNNQAANAAEIQIERSVIRENGKNKEAIQQLIRQVLSWADYESSMSLFPVLEERRSVRESNRNNKPVSLRKYVIFKKSLNGGDSFSGNCCYLKSNL